MIAPLDVVPAVVTCPACGHTDAAGAFTAKYCPAWPDRCSGCEIHEDRYDCPTCGHQWKVNA